MSDLLKVRVGGSRYLCKWEKTIQVGNIKYPIVRVGDQWWITEDLKNDVGVYWVVNGVHYYKPNGDSYRALMALFPAGWRITTLSDLQTLNNLYSGQLEKLCSTEGWDGLGTNESGLNFLQNGAMDLNGRQVNVNESLHMRQYDASRPSINNDTYSYILYISGNSIVSRFAQPDNYNMYYPGRVPLRICCNA